MCSDPESNVHVITSFDHRLNIYSTANCFTLQFLCLPDNCPCPSSPENGYIASCVGSALVGTYIHYYCDSGYERVGDFSRKCEVGATWTGSTPTCEKSELMHEIISKDIFHATMILTYTQPFDVSDEMSLYNVIYLYTTVLVHSILIIIAKCTLTFEMNSIMYVYASMYIVKIIYFQYYSRWIPLLLLLTSFLFYRPPS